MKKLVLIVLLIILSVFLFGEKIVPLPELQKPENIIIDQGQILMTEFPNVYVYSLEDFKLIVKFGKKGEGPQEFFNYVRIQLDPKQPEYIIVGSHMKMSYFTREGKFVKEARSKGDSGASVYKPLGDKYVSYGFAAERETRTLYQK